MKKGIGILLFLCVSLPLKAQNSKELIEILLDFCQQVTQEEPSEEKIYAIFQSISPEKKYLLLEEKENSFAGFTQEKVAYIDLDKKKYNNTKLIAYKRAAEHAYTLDLFLHSPYSIKAGKVSYEKAIYPISFPELTEKLGRVFYDPIFQAKDTKRSNYIYQNPQTHKGVVFSIVSYNPPEAPYNIIYRIEIEDIRFFDEASLSKGKFYMKEFRNMEAQQSKKKTKK